MFGMIRTTTLKSGGNLKKEVNNMKKDIKIVLKSNVICVEKVFISQIDKFILMYDKLPKLFDILLFKDERYIKNVGLSELFIGENYRKFLDNMIELKLIDWEDGVYGKCHDEKIYDWLLFIRDNKVEIKTDMNNDCVKELYDWELRYRDYKKIKKITLED
jgi:hypothetical protein